MVRLVKTFSRRKGGRQKSKPEQAAPREQKKKLPYDNEDLVAASKLRCGIGALKMPFGKHKSKPISAIPSDYLEWMCDTLDKNDRLRLDAARVLAQRFSPKKGKSRPPKRRQKQESTVSLEAALNHQHLSEINMLWPDESLPLAPWEGPDEFAA